MDKEYLYDQVSGDIAWRLQRCDGFMDLKMWDRALQEFKMIPEICRGTQLYRQTRLRLAMEMSDWPFAAMLARALQKGDPDEPGHWLQLAYAVRRFKDVESARTILVEAQERFPAEPLIPFNLACYECQLGDQDKALEYLDHAFRMNPDCRDLALSDQDLRPLWNLLEIEV